MGVCVYGWFLPKHIQVDPQLDSAKSTKHIEHCSIRMAPSFLKMLHKDRTDLLQMEHSWSKSPLQLL